MKSRCRGPGQIMSTCYHGTEAGPAQKTANQPGMMPIIPSSTSMRLLLVGKQHIRRGKRHEGTPVYGTEHSGEAFADKNKRRHGERCRPARHGAV